MEVEEQNLDTQAEQQATQDNQSELMDTRDIVAREFDKLEAAEAEKVEAPKGEGKPRDESGKFKKKEEEQKLEVEQQSQEAEQPPEQKPARNPYASWKKEAQAELSKLPENVQQMIQERESQFHKGIQGYKDDAIYGRQLKQAIEPYSGYLQELGADASQAIPALLSAEMTLRKGTMEQKHQMFLQLAHDYGVDLSSIAQTPFNPVEYQLRQQLTALQQQVSGLGQSRQMAEEANLSQTIEQFAEGKEFFEDVRETMADLLDRGLATDLDDAYTKALRLNDDVFGKWQAQQQANAERQKLEQANQAAKAAKAAAVSVKGAPTGATRGPEPKSTEDAVRQAFAALGM